MRQGLIEAFYNLLLVSVRELIWTSHAVLHAIYFDCEIFQILTFSLFLTFIMVTDVITLLLSDILFIYRCLWAHLLSRLYSWSRSTLIFYVLEDRLDLIHQHLGICVGTVCIWILLTHILNFYLIIVINKHEGCQKVTQLLIYSHYRLISTAHKGHWKLCIMLRQNIMFGTCEETYELKDDECYLILYYIFL